MSQPTGDDGEARSDRDASTPYRRWPLGHRRRALVLLALVLTVFGAGAVAGAPPANDTPGGAEPSVALTTASPVADCTVSATEVRVGESVTLDASGSQNADSHQYDRYGGSSFGQYTDQSSRTVSYAEPGTYDPRVKVWSYDGSGEESDIATCGTVTVTEATLTPTPTPTATATPTPSPVADCTVSATDIRVGESVTLDASGSQNVDSHQYDRYGDSSFGQYTDQPSRTVSYGEPGTYDPRVKVWSYSGSGEESDIATCGTVTVTEATPTPTPTPTPSPVADCTVSDTSVRVGESVTLDASGSQNVDSHQYDRYGDSSFGEFTDQPSRTVSYAEPGTYDPRVKVWSYSGSGEESDIATCGTVTVTDPTPTPEPTADAECVVSATDVRVGESVTLDASDSQHADDFQYDRYGDSAFGQYTSQRSRTVSYAEPGTYDPRVKVWSYAGTETSDVATCGTVTVTEATPTATVTPSPTPTATVTPTPTPTATATPTFTPTPTSGTGGSDTPTPTLTPVPTTATPTPTDTATSVPSTGTPTTDGEAWFEYDPSDPGGNDSVRLVARPSVERDAVETYGWDLDGDGTADRRGRELELPGTAGAETAITLLVERTDGSTARVTRDVPVAALDGETAASGGETTGPGDGGGLMVPALAVLLLLILLLAALVVARSRAEDEEG